MKLSVKNFSQSLQKVLPGKNPLRTMQNLLVRKNFARPLLAILALCLLFVITAKISPNLGGKIFCVLLLGGYYGVIIYSTKFCNINFREIFIGDLLRILLVAAIGTGFIVFMINSQHTIYTSDSLETWEPAIFCEEMTFTNPLASVKHLIKSINYDDYNSFIPLLISLPMHIFGRSFLHYELYIWFMFGLPAIFFAAATFKTIFENAGIKIFSCSAIMAIMLLFPVFEIPIFIGYANISILLPGAIILAMLLSLDKLQLQIKPLILIAILCIFAVFQARTAAYMIIGIFSGYTFYIIVSGFQERTVLLNLIMLCKKFLFIGVAGFVMALPLFFPFIKHALTYDIGTAYAAYSHGYNFPTKFLFHIGYLGFIIYGLFIIGTIIGLRNKKFAPFAALLLVWAVIPAALICKVQLVDRHHFYTIVLPFACLVMMLIAFAWSRKKTIGAAVICILTLNLIQSFSPTLNLSPYFNSCYQLPVRHDIEDMKNFVADLNKLTEGTDKKIYPITSNGLYNGHTFSKLYLPDNRDALRGMLVIHEIDLKNGFPIHFFDADYVIIPEPLQTHLRDEDQSVIIKLANLISKPSPIAKHFKKIKEQTFHPETNGVSSVTFSVYEKVVPFDKSDIDYVEKIFVDLYPNNNDLFRDRFEQYKSEHFKE